MITPTDVEEVDEEAQQITEDRVVVVTSDSTAIEAVEVLAMTEPETYFSHKERLFPELADGPLIPTEQFLRGACNGIANFVGILGTAFAPVKSDFAGNVQKVHALFEMDRERYRFLQDLVRLDVEENGGKLGTATEGLLWLKWGLEFLLELLKQMVREYRQSMDEGDPSKTENFAGILQSAYQKTLMVHHNSVSKITCALTGARSPIALKELAYGKPGLDAVCGRASRHNFEPLVRPEIFIAIGLPCDFCVVALNKNDEGEKCSWNSPTHRSVLSKGSPVFKALLDPDSN